MGLFCSFEATLNAAYADSFSKKKKKKKRRVDELNRVENQNRRIKTSNKENDRTPLKYLNVLHRNRTQK